MAYIEKEKISSHIRENFSIDKTKNADICFAFIDFMNWLDDQPTADVKEVVKAKSEAYREMGKYLIDKSKNGIVLAADIPDYVKELSEVSDNGNL